MLRYKEGEAVNFPFAVRVHLVASRYGQSPAQVREWPASDFLVACRLLEISG